MNTSSTRWAQSYAELGHITPRVNGGVGVSAKQAQNNVAAFGIKKTAKGWDVADYLRHYQESRRGDLNGDGSLKDEKIKREIRLLDLEIDERLGKLKPQDEWMAEVRDIAAITKASLQHFVAWVSAEMRTPEAYNKANELAARLCAQLEQKVSDASGNG